MLEAPNPVVRVRVVRVEVEHEDQVTPLEHDELVHLILAGDVSVGRVHKTKGLVQVHQGPVIRVHELVLERVRVRQIPPPAALIVGAPVTRDELPRGGVVGVVPWEVNPLRVPKLVAHEVQIALPAQGRRNGADHLVQGNTPVHDIVLRVDLHPVVHLSIHEPERNGLVSHQGLVVRLCVTNAGLAVPPIGQRVADVPHGPVLVRPRGLHDVDPLVCDGHLQPVIEAHASLGDWPAEGGHARDILANGHRVGEDAMDHVVRQHQVHHGVEIGLHAEVLVVVSREGHLEAVVVVHHASDTIKAEAVELVLVQPPPAVRKQKPQDLPVPIVEQPAVPHPVVAFGARVEVLAVRTVKEVDPVVRVARGMRVDDINEDK